MDSFSAHNWLFWHFLLAHVVRRGRFYLIPYLFYLNVLYRMQLATRFREAECNMKVCEWSSSKLLMSQKCFLDHPKYYEDATCWSIILLRGNICIYVHEKNKMQKWTMLRWIHKATESSSSKCHKYKGTKASTFVYCIGEEHKESQAFFLNQTLGSWEEE